VPYDKKSYGRILRSTSVIGGSSLANVIIGLLGAKVIAVLLGPTGIGLLSLYKGLIQTASSFASVGIGMTATRQLADASAKQNYRLLYVTRKAIFYGTFFLASFGALALWLLRDFFALHVLGTASDGYLVGWLSLGVALSVITISQSATLQGMRRIGDIAKINVYGSLLSTIFGLLMIWIWGQNGLIGFVLGGPFISYLIGSLYISRLPKIEESQINLEEIYFQWKYLLRLGVPFMGAGLVGALVQLWIRVEIGNSLGIDSVGYYQAAWSISMQYIGFILLSMSADFYPALTQVIGDKKAATKLVNEQTEVALLISAPVFIAMMGLCPWIIEIMYSSQFLLATDILRWQLLGDVLKVTSWPLGFVILSSGAGKTYFLTESFSYLLMGILIYLLCSKIGLEITGIAFLISYIAMLPIVYWLAKIKINFKFNVNIIFLSVIIFLSCCVVWIMSVKFVWGSILGLCLAFIFSLYSANRILKLSNLGDKISIIRITIIKIFKKSGSKNG
jgi:PST family polysaccharide transporter